MKKPSISILLGLAGLGLIFGFSARFVTQDRDLQTADPIAGVRETPATSTANAPSPVFPLSSDTLESLLAAEDPVSYVQLAHWLVGASAQDIAAYWDFYQKQGDPSDQITKLIFLNWTRLDALAAIAGDTKDRHAWWAWACHDPRAALTAAIAAGPDELKTVVGGIGELQPDWLRRHFDEIPAGARKEALAGMSKWGDVENPLAMVEFSRKFGLKPDAATLKALINKDPWTAFDWVKENGGLRYDPFMDQLVSQMAEENPDDLARLASQTPSGTAKRKMEAALFENLLKSDPKAAIAEATAIKAPRLAAERLAAVGLSLVKSDPARAMEMAESLLTICPDAMMKSHSKSVPGGSSSGWASAVEGVTELMNSLLSEDPATLLDTVVAKKIDGLHRNSGLDSLSEQWLERDLVTYAEWLKLQTQTEVRNDGTNKVIQRLIETGEYQDAADWALSLTNNSQDSTISAVTWEWAKRDAQQASEWLEATDLPEEQKMIFRRGISRANEY